MVFPFGVGDPRDDIDRVARELTGNQFRLKRDDPDAGQKFLNFVAESEGQFMQVQRAQGAVSPTDPRGIQAPPAPAPVAGQPQAAQPFETGGFQRAPQPEPSYGPINPEFVRQLGDQRGSFGDFVTTPIIDREVAEDAARNVARFMPLLGEGVAANIGGAASEITTLPDLAIGSLTAGFGAPIAGAASRIPFAGRVLRPLLEPISGSPGRALAAEAAAGTGAVFGAERTAEALEDTDIPAPLKTALTLGGGLATGVGTVTTPSVARRLGRTALEAGEQAAEAIGRTGVGNVLDPVPARQVAARAAGDDERTIRSLVSKVTEDLNLSKDEASQRLFDKPISQMTDDELRVAQQHAQGASFSSSPQIHEDGNKIANAVGAEIDKRLGQPPRVSGTVDPEDAIEAEVARIRQQRQIPQTVEEAIDAPDVPEVISRSTELPRSELSASEQLFGLSGRVDTGLTRAERLANRARQTISGSNISDIQGISRTLGAEADPIIEPIFRERKRVIQNAEQLANSVTSRVSPQVRRAFDISDNGIINSLAGIDPDLPVAPTIQDVAARLPRFLSSLTPEQRAVMEQLRKIAEPYGRALRESGDDFGTRTDIMEGGFYLPRGNAANGDLAIGVARGSRRPGASIGQEQSARFNSMAEGLAGGWEYDTFDNALRGLITRSGQRVADNFTQNTLRQARDEGGQKLGLTIKELLVRDNPVVAGQFDTLRASALKLKNLLKNKDSQAIRNLERLLADPEFDDVAEVRRVFFNSRQILRGELKGQNVAQVREALSDLQRELAEFRPIYEQAKKSAARNAGRRAIGGAEAFPQLNGVTFPERMAARANEILAQEQARVPKTIEAIDAIQRVWKAGNATLDNSGIGIQNLLNTFDNPRRGLRAAKESIKAWRDPAVYSDWASGFNSKVAAEGRLTTDEWAGQYGLAQLGRAEDVASGILESIPGAGRVFQGADRAFATVSDVARAEWADDLLREELLQGKTIDSLRADGTLQQIANTVNAATGFVQGDFSLANLAMFSARFFTARILTMLRAIRGMDIDAPLDLIPVAGRRLQRDLPKVNKFSRTQDKYARRALMRMIGYGTLLTVALNELQGQDTDFRPVVNGKYNSNFLRFRAFNRDWSVFGPWDSLARMLVNVGNLRTKDTVRSLGNAPFVAMGMDLYENKDFLGRPLFNPKGSKPEQAAQITQYFAEGVLPFAASEAGELSGEAKDNLSEGDWLGLGLTGLFALSEGFGIKSSPLSTAELRALAENPSTSPEMRAEINQEIRERQQGFRRFDNNQSQGQSTADRIFGGN